MLLCRQPMGAAGRGRNPLLSRSHGRRSQEGILRREEGWGDEEAPFLNAGSCSSSAAAATTRMNDGHLRCPKEHRGAERRMGGAGIGSCGEPEAKPLSR